MKKLKTIIIDDEPSAIDRLADMLKRNDKVQVIGTFTESVKGVELAKDADLILLDIMMPHFDGIQFAQNIRTNAEIIFVTGDVKRSIESLGAIGVITYILKPVNELNLAEAIDRVYRIKFSQSFPPPSEDTIVNPAFEMVAVKTLTHTYLIKYSEILYGRAHKGNVMLKTVNGNIIVKKTLEGLLEKLSNPIFIRTHNQSFVNKLFIDKVDDINIYLRDCKDSSDILEISRGYKESFWRQLEQ